MRIKFYACPMYKTVTTPSIAFSWDDGFYELRLDFLFWVVGIFFIIKEESDE